MTFVIFASTALLLGSNMSYSEEYHIDTIAGLPSEFDNLRGDFTLYYDLVGTPPSSSPTLNLYIDNNLYQSKSLNFTDDIYINGGSTQNNTYYITFSINSFNYDSIYKFTLTNISSGMIGNGYRFYITYNVFDVNFDSIRDNAYDEGYNYGLDVGFDNGRIVGFDEGFAAADENVIGNSLLSIADIPFKILNDFIGFDILGFNIVTFLTGILGIALVAFLIKALI